MTQQPQDLNLKKMLPIAIIVGSILILIIFWNRMTYNVDAGHQAIIFETLSDGIDPEQVPMGEGFHFIAPWNKAIIYSVQKKEKTEIMNVLSSNQLHIDVEVSAWFKPNSPELPLLHQKIGAEYETNIVIPALRSATRSVIGKYTPEELSSSKRIIIQDEIFQETKEILDDNFIFLDKILIRSIVLPDKLVAAIERKLEQEQLAAEYEFKLKREEKEAERKRIAAEGEAAANKIINSSLTPALLKMRGIEATIKLSESDNAKVIVIGSGKDGMPLILGNQ